MKCKMDGCEKQLRSDNSSGYCGTHRWKVRPYVYRPRKHRKEYRHQYYLANKEAETKRARDWEAANPEQVLEKGRGRTTRYRNKKALEALAQARATAQPSKPSPAASRLVELAKVKAEQAMYGIERIGYAR